MALHDKAEQFFSLLGANEKFIVSKSEYGSFKTSFYSIDTADFYDRISLGETESTTSYTVDNAIKTKVLAVIDIDTKNIEPLLQKLEENNIFPTIITETNKGFHLLYLSKDWIYNEGETLFVLKNYLQNLTYKLKDYNIDKAFNENYTRIPKASKTLTITDNFYTVETFLIHTNKAFNVFPELIDKKFDLLNYSKIKVKFTPEVNKTRLIQAEEDCPSLKNILENPESHDYASWLVMARHYANRYNSGDSLAETLFFGKAQSYKDYDHKQNVNLWEKYTQDKVIIPLSCKYIHENCSLSICEDCPYGEVKGSPYFRKDALVIRMSNYIADDKYIYKITTTPEKETKFLPVAKSFIIKDVIQYQDEDATTQILTVIKTPDGRTHKIRHTNENLPKDLHRSIETQSAKRKDREVLEQIFLDNYALALKHKLIIPYKLNYWDLHFAPLSEEYRTYLDTIPFIVYQQNGDFQKWFKSYKRAFEIDKIIQFLTGVYLTQYFISNDYSYHLASLNPVILILGMMGTGKTIRMLIVNSLYTKPDNRYTLENIYSASLPYLAKYQSRVELPIWIDEIKSYTTQEANKFAEIIYFTANSGSRANLSSTRKVEFRCPVVFSGEVNNVRLPQATAGIFRRVLPITITSDYVIEKDSEIIRLLNSFRLNYGYADKFFEDFTFNEDRLIEISKQVSQARPTIHVSLQQHLSAIFYMIEEFSKWLGLNYDVDYMLKEYDFIDYDRIEAVRYKEDTEEVGSKTFWEVVENYLYIMKEKRRKEGEGASVSYRGEVGTLLSPLDRKEKAIFKLLFGMRKKSGTAVYIRFLGSNPLVRYAVGERADVKLEAVNRLIIWYENQAKLIEETDITIEEFNNYVCEFLDRFISEDVGADKVEQIKQELRLNSKGIDF